MIKKLIRRLLGQRDEAPAAVPRPETAAAAMPAVPASPALAPVAADAAPEARSGRSSRTGARGGQGGRRQRAAEDLARPDRPLHARAAAGEGAQHPAGEEAPARPGVPQGRRVEVPAEDHGIDPALVDDRANKVVATLKQAGYQAFVVGGAVRDLLVGRRPKDFDVATDATPEEVKALFRRAFIIGRRFRIVHVVFGRGREHDVIEVSTFRAYLDSADAKQVSGNERSSKSALANQAHAVDASGRVLRDNVWGPQIEDAARRDFTVNAMYYDPQRQVVVDYHGGLADIRARTLRLIGDPGTRYREDPVRILRAVRFAAKLGFTLDPATEAPIAESRAQLADVPISRMFDEMIKLLQTGHALASIESLKALGLERGIFPVLDAVFDPSRTTEQSLAFVRRALADTDRRVAEGKPVAPSFLLACLLWHDVLVGWRQNQAAGEPVVPALQQAIDAVFDARIGDVSGRGKLGTDMRETWMMQPRFERRQPNTARAMVEQPRFRAAFDFLRLRADNGEVPAELAEWWEDFSLGSEDDREAMIEALREQQRPAAKRGRKAPVGEAGERGVGAADGPGVSGDDDGGEFGDGDEPAVEADADEAIRSAPRKRRRRRRKPSGGSGSGGAEAGAGGSAEAPAPTD